MWITYLQTVKSNFSCQPYRKRNSNFRLPWTWEERNGSVRLSVRPFVCALTTEPFDLFSMDRVGIHSEIDQIHLSIKAQCVTTLLPLGKCHMWSSPVDESIWVLHGHLSEFITQTIISFFFWECTMLIVCHEIIGSMNSICSQCMLVPMGHWAFKVRWSTWSHCFPLMYSLVWPYKDRLLWSYEESHTCQGATSSKWRIVCPHVVLIESTMFMYAVHIGWMFIWDIHCIPWLQSPGFTESRIVIFFCAIDNQGLGNHGILHSHTIWSMFVPFVQSRNQLYTQNLDQEYLV